MVKKVVYQFKISLKEIKPLIWRRILVPETYSFWDLHVAIQDSMGWLDCHLHAFRFETGRSPVRWEIGIPDDEGFGDIETLSGWDVAMVDHFKKVGSSCIYEYDFGDGWLHEVLLEGIILGEKRRRYPQCIEGERSCPPEDCGGIHGYYHLLDVISDPGNDEYKDMMTWVGKKFDPEYCAIEKIKFDNPSERWELAFSHGL